MIFRVIFKKLILELSEILFQHIQNLTASVHHLNVALLTYFQLFIFLSISYEYYFEGMVIEEKK